MDPAFGGIDPISIIVAFIIPLAVAVVARANWPKTAKSITNLGLTALTTALTASAGATASEVAVTFGMTWATSIASYYGLWKPSGVADRVNRATGGQPKPVGAGGSFDEELI